MIYRWWAIITNVPYRIKWWWQKQTTGYSDVELWNFDGAIAIYIYKGLQKFRDNVDRKEHHSLPMSRDPEKDMEAIETNEWLEILDKIIWSFKYAADDHFPFCSEHATDLISYEEYDKLERSEKNDLWKACSEKYDEGIQLFATWFGNFWD